MVSIRGAGKNGRVRMWNFNSKETIRPPLSGIYTPSLLP